MKSQSNEEKEWNRKQGEGDVISVSRWRTQYGAAEFDKEKSHE